MTSEGKRKQSAGTKPLSSYRVKQKNISKGVINEIECQTDELIQLHDLQAKAGRKND